MVRQDIISGLRNAVERGYSIEQAKVSMINAGYAVNEVDAAANYLVSGISFNLNQAQQSQQASQKPSLQQLQEFKQQYPQLPSVQIKETSEKSPVLLIILLLILLFILLVILGVVLFFKEEIVNFLRNLFS